MLDIGWPELFLIAVVTIVVVGPKELPRVVRAVTGLIRKARGLADEFRGTLDDMAREADLEDIKKEVERAAKVDVAEEFEAAVDPAGDMDGAFDLDEPASPASGAAATAAAKSAPADGDRREAPPEGEGGAGTDAADASAAPDAEPPAEPPVENAAGGRSGT